MEPGEIALYVLQSKQREPEYIPLKLIAENRGVYTATAHHSCCILYFRIIQLDSCWIWHTRFIIQKKMELIARPAGAVTFLWLAWKKTLVYTIEGIPVASIKPGCYNIYYQPPGTGWTIHFDKPGTWETFNILFNGPELSGWRAGNPLLQAFLRETAHGKTVFLRPESQRLTAKLRASIGDMINPPPDTGSAAYYENKMPEFLRNILERAALPSEMILSYRRIDQAESRANIIRLSGKDKNGTVIFQLSGSFGEVFLRITPVESGFLWESRYRIKQALILSLSANTPFLGLVYTLKNELQYTPKGLRKGLLLKDQFNMFFTPSIDAAYTFPSRGDAYTLAIQLSPSVLEEWMADFSLPTSFLRKVNEGNPALISPRHWFLSRRMREHIDEILLCTTGKKRQTNKYLQIQTDHLLLETFHALISGTSALPVTLHVTDRTSIRKTWFHRLAHMDTQIPLKELAANAGMSRTKFHAGFKQLYGDTPSHVYQEARLQKAIQLLKNPNLSVEAIATITGFENRTHFSRAFKRRFGHPPTYFKQ